jgi:hypothetical protein
MKDMTMSHYGVVFKKKDNWLDIPENIKGMLMMIDFCKQRMIGEIRKIRLRASCKCCFA